MVEVRADQRATVQAVVVAVGDQVQEGQELLVLESMKVEIPVESPAAGTVVEVRVQEGGSVAEDDLLLTLEE